jgi:hypothetical protein
VIILCPACGKANPGAPGLVCARCEADLSLLQLIRAAAERHQTDAIRRLKAKNWPEALWHAQQSWELYHSEPGARLAFLAAAALGDFPTALTWHRRAAPFDEPEAAG